MAKGEEPLWQEIQYSWLQRPFSATRVWTDSLVYPGVVFYQNCGLGAVVSVKVSVFSPKMLETSIPMF